MQKGQLHKKQLFEANKWNEQGSLWRTAGFRSQISPENHGQAASRAKDFRRCIVRIGLRRRGGWLYSWSECLSGETTLQDNQFAPNGSAKETVIAHLDKGMREDMLEETLKELLHGKRTFFELAGIGNAVLKGNLRIFHGTAVIKRKQAPITDGNAMNIGSQILESGLPIANGLAVNDPFLSPDPGGNLVKEFQFD